MVTGRKPAADLPAGDEITHSRMPLAVAIVAALVFALVLAVRAAPDATIALY
jgi:hypothetical protein